MTSAQRKGIVVTGTDTGVGKTLVAATLLAALRDVGVAPLRYVKPVQTGFPPDDDAAWVARRVPLAPEEVLATAVRLRAPASPFEAARLEGGSPSLPRTLPDAPTGAFVVVEGAGGLLVPFDDHTTLADAFVSFGLPLLVVARPDVGTLNHTLLTLEAARRRGLHVAGVVVSREPTPAVMDALRRHGGAPVLVLPRADDPDDVPALARRWLADPSVRAFVEGLVPEPFPTTRGPANLRERDAACVWHPYTQHGVARPPLPVVAAAGAWLTLADGRRVLDGISSWWTSLVGHGHPAIVEAIARQARVLDHVSFGGATHEPAVALAERLVALAPRGLSRVFYSDNGSTAVEVALKLALAWHRRRGDVARTRFVALEGAYHGDTVGAMSVSEDGPFVADFAAVRFPVLRTPVPRDEASVASCVEALEARLSPDGPQRGAVAAVVVEPLLLGAAGMRVYPETFLRAVADLTRRHGALLVADEVFTGFGRTGTRFACERAGVVPDLFCVSKALTGGTLPLSATLATEPIFEAFCTPRTADAFLHGHSYTANPIACAAALATVDLLDETALARGRAIGARIAAGLASLRGRPGVRDVRGIGIVNAVEVHAGPGGYLADVGRRMADAALREGVWLRPLGDVVYAVPPLCVTDAEADRITAAIRAAVAVAVAP